MCGSSNVRGCRLAATGVKTNPEGERKQRAREILAVGRFVMFPSIAAWCQWRN